VLQCFYIQRPHSVREACFQSKEKACNSHCVDRLGREIRVLLLSWNCVEANWRSQLLFFVEVVIE
jgi:hypothetical protein